MGTGAGRLHARLDTSEARRARRLRACARARHRPVGCCPSLAPCAGPGFHSRRMPPGSQLAPTRADRAALLALQFGALAVVLASVPYKAFDLDRYFVPKELVLHLCAATAA